MYVMLFVDTKLKYEGGMKKFNLNSFVALKTTKLCGRVC